MELFFTLMVIICCVGLSFIIVLFLIGIGCAVKEFIDYIKE